MLEMGLHVTFVADNLACEQPYAHDLQQLGVEFWHAPYIQSVSELLAHDWASEYILCRDSSAGCAAVVESIAQPVAV
jgi:hypothetical protein